MRVNDLVTANANQHHSGTRFIKKVLGGVAQLVRAIACHAIGRGFESLHSRHIILDTSLVIKFSYTVTFKSSIN